MAAEVKPGKSSADAHFKYWPIKGPEISAEYRNDGSILLRSRHAIGAEPRSIAHLFVEQASAFPERPFLQQRLAGRGPQIGTLAHGPVAGPGAASLMARHFARRRLSLKISSSAN